MAPKRLSFSVNPLWSHYVAIASVAFALLLGAARYFIVDRTDPLHCDALLTEGRWLDDKWKNWQPEGCMMYTYQPTDISTCLATRRVVFIGDSVTRQLFFQLLHIADPALPVAPPDDTRKHADHTFTSSTGIHFTFIWDPYLNSSQAQSYINPPGAPSSPSIASPPSPDPEYNRPALLVLGSGLWYLRYAEAGSGGLPAWEAQMEATLAALAHGHAADTAVVLPIEDVIPAKLDRARAASMHASDIDAMNSDLLHRIRPPAHTDPYAFFPGWGAEPRLDPGMAKGGRLPVSLPLVFNKMLDESQTADGLHFSDAVVRAQAQVLLNARCNDALPKTFPLDKTCCNAYPRPAPLYALVLAAAIMWGPVVVLLLRRVGSRAPGQPLIADHEMPAVVFSAAAALIYLADRTGFWLKEQKQFSPWTFSFLSLLSLVVGLITVRRADKDLGFLNREQTDEWKGWMQIAILIYHYTGASKVSGIYNPIRVLVASYLFMTGYGHTTYYVKKADFGFTRIAQILIRLNLLTILLAYLMNTDYLSYYFAPLVSWWFLVIYATMALGSQYNERTVFLVGKIVVSMVFVAWFMGEAWILEAVFQFLERVCGIHWSAREWSFRVNLDLWIVYVGMLTALSVIKIREHRLTDHPQWPLATKVASGASALALLWFLAFELMQSDKFAYNRWHPYVSFLPVLAFVVLRNATGILRSASSRMFAFVGTCSLETFIIQYHLWLAGDTKGILLVIPGTRWRPANLVLTTIVFVYVSHRVAQATGEVTNWVCGTGKPQTLPTTAEPAPSSSRRAHAVTPAGEGEVIFLVSQDGEQRKDNDGNDLPPEPDTPARPPRRWVDRLAEESSASQSSSPGFRVWYGETEWQPGVGTKLAITAVALWLLNITWPYSPA